MIILRKDCIIFIFFVLVIHKGQTAQYSSVTSLYDFVTSAGNYTHIRPEANLNTATSVAFKFSLTNLQEINDNKGLFSIAGFFELQWKDNNLIWDPNDYDGEISIRVPIDKIWKPHLIIGNPYKSVTVITLLDSTIRVYEDGTSYWIPAGNFEMSCDADVSYFPFDSQTCEMMVIPWQYSSSEIAVMITQTTVDTTYYSVNPEWDYVSSNVYLKNETNILHFSMTFKRRPTFFMMNIKFPIILLGILNLFVFILPVESGERVGFGITVLLAIAVFMTVVADSLPQTTSPRMSAVGIFLCIDLVLSSSMMICTMMGLALYHRDELGKPVTPFWKRIAKTNLFSCKKKITHESDKDIVTWKNVSNSLDKIFLLTFSILIFIGNLAFFLDIIVGVNK